MRSEKTLAELTAWLGWHDSGATPDAQALADFLGIELAEPATPVGQRRRSPSGVEVVKTDNGFTEPWRKYRGRNPGPTWFADVEVAGWGVITDAPECDREHLPSHSVRICLATISDEFIADLARGAGSPIGPVADAAHRERERRRRLQPRAAGGASS